MTASINTVDGDTIVVAGDPERIARAVMESRVRKRGEFLVFTEPSGARAWIANDRIASIRE